jgi:hypothetical protein
MRVDLLTTFFRQFKGKAEMENAIGGAASPLTLIRIAEDV